MLTVLTLPAGIMLAWYAQSAIREATEDTNGSDAGSSMARLSMSEWLAMRAAPPWGGQGEKVQSPSRLRMKKLETTRWPPVKQSI